ncbi:MAG: LUD domain-containing protein [Phycisphaerae bacterium]|nr:MAG: hypothetical protein EDS66_09230 [Planctomycetota bacterium]KAB2947407.1 MAG: hypothetical protein F9K17_07315 [Phycisphaerae bacterium]MBE7456359.1 LUD domain-containing protein [Planctomycetia bacterium]MCK6465689.1 LUD domain-containing protein [Phycisphaerae bacterium]MCL4718477.1 LUD domain-containing protein [Phycisphaerae bacterium]
MSESRNKVLARIREAVANVPSERRAPRPEVPPSVLRQVEPSGDLVRAFCEQAKAMGLAPSVVADSDVGRHVADLLRAEKASKITLEPDLPWENMIRKACPDAILLDPARGDEAFYGADIGITGALYAVAETGSVVVDNAKRRYRSLTLIPPLHIVLVRASRVIADLVDLFGGSDGRPADAASPAPTAAPCAPDLPSNLTLITGPSKTADIEGVLVTGIHGPCKVFVVVVT